MNNVKKWNELFKTGNLEGLKDLLDRQTVFYSPLVFKPQVGRALTSLYLKSAYKMFFGIGNNSFKYIREIHSDTDTMLEFTCEIEGVLINGVDLIKWNEKGKIQEIKVMIRPNKAIEKVKEKMSENMANISAMDKIKLKTASFFGS
ncbi:hypothetical protein [Algoriphagus sediminis]|uniref:Nuclear transport factor 2 family protein n=1 Tax=Algoriphagus sediminis TaxID=3057113 RepID=A0ABT7YB62_9BACT|nr:hypothetical protein [Algoriphagus sediminis]MDN3203764.1 hypothetical protein [Algoriphagus sediminis]